MKFLHGPILIGTLQLIPFLRLGFMLTSCKCTKVVVIILNGSPWGQSNVHKKVSGFY